MTKKIIGHILSGSLSEGLTMRLSADIEPSELKAGKFVSITTQQAQFFSLVTDIQLGVAHPDILLFPPTEKEAVLTSIVRKRDMYTTAILRPLLMLTNHHKPAPVKTIPHHFSPVYEADKADIKHIFGDETEPTRRFFNIGSPIDMDAPVCIDLEKLTERSTGIFGKTGTGKTFLTRLLLAGLVHNDKAVTIIFDTHSEYGLQARKEGGQAFVKGLKTLFPHKTAIFSLDPVSTRRRGGQPDVVLTLNYQSIMVEDVLSLQEELNLHPTACEAAYLIAAKYKKDWLAVLLSQEDRLKEFAAEVGAHPESIGALYRKLRHIERLPFFVKDGVSDVVTQMMEYINRGTSIVIEFGNHGSTFCYLLIANVITRHLHALYVQKTEKFLGSHAPQDEPQKLIIVVEEAHKFLNPQAARQTIFGTIAREMRKYYVSLLIVDQRPSGIDAEVLSQLGTKIIAQLNDDRDIQAVLTGVSNANQLRTVMAALETKKQAIVLGHAVPMPIMLETRSYDADFYKAVSLFETKTGSQLINELF